MPGKYTETGFRRPGRIGLWVLAAGFVFLVAALAP